MIPVKKRWEVVLTKAQLRDVLIGSFLYSEEDDIPADYDIDFHDNCVVLYKKD